MILVTQNGHMVLLAMRSIVQRRRAVFLCRSLTASFALGLLGHARVSKDEARTINHTSGLDGSRP